MVARGLRLLKLSVSGLSGLRKIRTCDLSNTLPIDFSLGVTVHLAQLLGVLVSP